MFEPNVTDLFTVMIFYISDHNGTIYGWMELSVTGQNSVYHNVS